MKDRWESDFPTTGNGLYSLVAVGASGHPTRVKQPPGTSPVQGCDDVKPVSGSGFGKRNQSRGETSFSIRAGAKREVRRAKGWWRTDGRTDSLCAILLDHPAILRTRGNCYLWGSGGRGAIVCAPLATWENPLRWQNHLRRWWGKRKYDCSVRADRNTIWIFQGDSRKKSWQDKESCEVEKALVRCVKGFLRNLLWNSSHNKFVVDSLCSFILILFLTNKVFVIF